MNGYQKKLLIPSPCTDRGGIFHDDVFEYTPFFHRSNTTSFAGGGVRISPNFVVNETQKNYNRKKIKTSFRWRLNNNKVTMSMLNVNNLRKLV